MQFSAALAVAALAGAAQAYYPSYPASNTTSTSTSAAVVYPTSSEVPYSTVTTYCSEAGTVTYGGSTYTVSTPGYLTYVAPVTYPTYTPAGPATTPASYPVYNSTYPTKVGTTSKYATSTPTPITYPTTGGASSLVAASGASLAGLFAFIAYAL